MSYTTTKPVSPYLAWYTSGSRDETISCLPHARKLHLAKLPLRPVAHDKDTASIYGYTCHYCDAVKRLKDDVRYFDSMSRKCPDVSYWTNQVKDSMWRLEPLLLEPWPALMPHNQPC